MSKAAASNRYSNNPHWTEVAQGAAHRAEIAASFDGDVSDDWLDDDDFDATEGIAIPAGLTRDEFDAWWDANVAA